MLNAREKMIEVIRNFNSKIVPYYAEEIVDKLIANDVMSVVRCKDCNYWNNPYCNHSESTMLDTQADNFCSYGERREGE